MATSLSSFLPAPKHTTNQSFREQFISNTPKVESSRSNATQGVPAYGKRSGWVPRVVTDFGDGGAFPEIHVPQFPLNMGRESNSSQTVPLTVDNQGQIRYDAVINPGGTKKLQSRHSDLVAYQVKEESVDSLARPSEDEERESTSSTKQALEAIINGKIASSQATSISAKGVDPSKPTYIQYTPQQPASMGGKNRIIRMTEMPSDPLEPPKFKHKKAPRGPPSPPVPVMHSPPRKITQKDQQDWKIPPCISNWKNNKGYTIPLDKRLAADGRGLMENQVNDNFAKLAEVMYSVEKAARAEVEAKRQLEVLVTKKAKEEKEVMLQKLAMEARAERTEISMSGGIDSDEAEARRERDQVRHQRRREIDRDYRMARNRSAASRNADRDISEKIALGQAVPQSSGEALFDQRLFNQSEGMDSGFGDEEGYTVYNKPLFHASSANTLYRPKKGDDDNYGGQEDYDKLLDTSKFKADKGFSGTESTDSKSQPRNAPVQFEKESDDIFGVNQFLNEAKSSTTPRGTLDSIGRSGHMKVSSGNIESAQSGGSKRSRINFQGSSSDDKRSRR
eukprot:TRINITY_DN19426_c0_g1_i1.p1 TRINITY_DN19426_c0_g1~~TRINITY_DN19426_c0_g1_i1.p1  ORF type:complete len:563 (-),score=152.12 TRINITY_DN19426_c0_g1_i1:49-1737(-)